MGRSKTLLDLSYQEVIASDLKNFANFETVIKLKAIMATLTYKESEVAEIFGISRSTLLRWVSTYKKYGVEGITNKSRGHNPSKLGTKEKEIIKEWIITCKDSQGKIVHWTLQRLIKEIKDVFQIEIKQTPLWITLHKMDIVLKKPRSKHHLSDDKAQEVFKKNSRSV